MKQAQGQYICFVDSDDWITPHYLQSMINNMSDDVDIVVSGITSFKEDKVVNIQLPIQNNIYSMNSNSADRFIADIDLFYGPVSKLYKKEIIRTHNITFPIDISLGEDMTFVFSYLSYTKKLHPFMKVITSIADSIAVLYQLLNIKIFLKYICVCGTYA